MDVKDINASISGNLLTIKGKNKGEEEKGDHQWYISDCRPFQHLLQLPANVQVDKARATSYKGILKIMLPKMEEPRKEEIKVEIKQTCISSSQAQKYYL